METPFKPQIQLKNVGPEVTSYIYQSIMELAPFTTPETLVSVIARDPLALLTFKQDADDPSQDSLPKKDKLKKMYRIAITLSEDGTKIEKEGLHENIYEAIRIAKDKLLIALNEIQDDVISNQDRQMQINSARTGTGGVH